MCFRIGTWTCCAEKLIIRVLSFCCILKNGNSPTMHINVVFVLYFSTGPPLRMNSGIKPYRCSTMFTYLLLMFENLAQDGENCVEYATRYEGVAVGTGSRVAADPATCRQYCFQAHACRAFSYSTRQVGLRAHGNIRAKHGSHFEAFFRSRCQCDTYAQECVRRKNVSVHQRREFCLYFVR
jgi:hypothetical protein